MDNFHIDVRATGEETFREAMKLAFFTHSAASGYVISEKKGFVLLWTNNLSAEGTFVAFPFAVTHDEAADFVWSWLKRQKASEEKPRHASPAWRIYTDSWGRVDGFEGSLAAIKPAWALSGK